MSGEIKCLGDIDAAANTMTYKKDKELRGPPDNHLPPKLSPSQRSFQLLLLPNKSHQDLAAEKCPLCLAPGVAGQDGLMHWAVLTRVPPVLGCCHMSGVGPDSSPPGPIELDDQEGSHTWLAVEAGS